jgi:hypothetical protein
VAIAVGQARALGAATAGGMRLVVRVLGCRSRLDARLHDAVSGAVENAVNAVERRSALLEHIQNGNRRVFVLPDHGEIHLPVLLEERLFLEFEVHPRHDDNDPRHKATDFVDHCDVVLQGRRRRLDDDHLWL